MSRTPRPLTLVAAGLLTLALSAPLSAPLAPASAAPRTASTADRASSHEPPTFTAGEARSILAKVQRAFTRHGSPAATGQIDGRRRSAHKGELSLALRDLALARRSLSPADRRLADRLLARPTNGAGQDPVKYGKATWRYHCFSGSMFCIHWVTNGPNRISLRDRNHNRIPDYVEYVVTTMNYVYRAEVGHMGYRMPLKDSDTAGVYRGNPNSKYDIYLAELGSYGLYGYCAPEWRGTGRMPYTQAGYCVLDNNYSPRQYGSANFLSPMRVTAAHEFFHDVQYAYDITEDSWFTEGTATWMEDEVFDDINDNLQYLPASPIRYPRSSIDYQTDVHRYGAWIFFKYAEEYLGTRNIVREMWEQAAATSTSIGPISINAVRYAVSARTGWNDFMAHFGLWNLLTPQPNGKGYEERATYPSPVYRYSNYVSASVPDTGDIVTSLRHTASAAIRVAPDRALPSGQQATLTVTAPAGTSRGSTVIVQTRYADGTVADMALPLDATTGQATTAIPFDPASIRQVVVLVANTSTYMTDCHTVAGTDGYEQYSCGGRGLFDDDSDFHVRVHLA